MKLRHAGRLLLVLALGLPVLRAQSVQDPVALPFLDLPPSPALNAIGGAGVALSTADPYGFLYNPAHLGSLAEHAHATVGFYPGGATEWLPAQQMSLRSTALGLAGAVTPRLTWGVGVAHTALEGWERPVPAAMARGQWRTYRPTDRYLALGGGLGYQGPVQVQGGATVRHVTSDDDPWLTPSGDLETGTIRGFSFDVGASATLPLLPLARLDRTVAGVRPALDVSVGYAQSHLGGQVRYSGSTAESLPRTARLGYSVTAGLDRAALRLVEATWTVQADHQLVRLRPDGTVSYEPFLGDLNPLRHVLRAEGDATTTVRRGWRVELAETVALSGGTFEGFGYAGYPTHGVEVRTAALVRGLARYTGLSGLHHVAERLDVRFTHASYFSNTTKETTFQGVALVYTSR